MTTVVFVRHAVTATTGKRLYGQSSGHHLNDHGRRQADALAERLIESGPAAVYSSPLERAQQTARPIARAAGLRVRTRKGLIEPDVGEWTNRALAQLRRRKDWRLVQRAPSRFRFPGGESFRHLQQRAADEVEGLVREHGDDTIVCVSHADTIKAVVAHYIGLHLDHLQRLEVSPASLTTLQLDPTGATRLLGLNDTGHLRDLR
ncbi:MAG: histidine phosphatase family protein [Actinobacteria bacterium]|nr:histidine phosphatase family protein [Actinomycetota bacterium]